MTATTEVTMGEFEAPELAVALLLPTPACPLWCEDEAGHPWDEVYPLRREHARRATVETEYEDATVAIYEWGEVGAHDYNPGIFVTGDDLTAAQAREVAAELVRMADLLEAK